MNFTETHKEEYMDKYKADGPLQKMTLHFSGEMIINKIKCKKPKEVALLIVMEEKMGR